MKNSLTLIFLCSALPLMAQYRYFDRAVEAYQAKQYQQAADNFEKYLNSNPNDGIFYIIEAYYFKALSHQNLKQFSLAAASFEAALQNGHPDKMDIHWLIGQCWLEDGQYHGAIEAFSRALEFVKNRRNESKLLMARAEAKAKAGRTADAYRDLSLALEKYPKNETEITELKRKISTQSWDTPNTSPQAQSFERQESYTEHTSDIETGLPKTRMKNPDAIAIVVGNSRYQNIPAVDYATNDAVSIRKYLIEVLGYSEGNVIMRQNISLGEFQTLFGIAGGGERSKLASMAKPTSDVFVYYSGHGYPSKSENYGYLVPVEADLNYIESSGYSLKTLYENLNSLQVKSITVVLDACFSGAGLMKNVSGMKPVPTGIGQAHKAVSICSSSGAQFSTWYKEKQHGLFTYFFLKAIHNQNGDSNGDGILTYAELYDYVSDKTRGVPALARKLHNLDQTPTIEGGNQYAPFVIFK